MFVAIERFLSDIINEFGHIPFQQMAVHGTHRPASF